MDENVFLASTSHNEVSNIIRKFLKDKDISAVDMIAYTGNTLAYLIAHYRINPQTMFEEMDVENPFISKCASASFLLHCTVVETLLRKENEIPHT